MVKKTKQQLLNEMESLGAEMLDDPYMHINDAKRYKALMDYFQREYRAGKLNSVQGAEYRRIVGFKGL